MVNDDDDDDDDDNRISIAPYSRNFIIGAGGHYSFIAPTRHNHTLGVFRVGPRCRPLAAKTPFR